MGFKFTRRRLGCYCVPKEGSSCCHQGWTGAIDRGFVKPAGGGAAARVAPQAPRRSGPSPAFRQGIKHSSLLCLPGDEDDETADGESIWFVNALGPQARLRLTPPRAAPPPRHVRRDAARTAFAPDHTPPPRRVRARRRRTKRL